MNNSQFDDVPYRLHILARFPVSAVTECSYYRRRGLELLLPTLNWQKGQQQGDLGRLRPRDVHGLQLR